MGTRWRKDSEEEDFMEIRARKRRAIVEETDDESEEDSNKDEEVSSEEEDMETGEENVDGIDVAESLYHSDDSHISEASVSSMGSSSGDGRDQCPVCLMTLKGQQLGKPNNCQHVFCLECIQEWAKNVNTCPVDRKTFNQIFVHNSKKGPVISKIKVEDRQMEEQFEEDEPTFCEVCNQCDREDVLLLCDGCDRGYHMDCLTPPLYRVPVEEWYCHQCRHDNQTEDMEESAAINRDTLRVTSQTRSRGPRVRSHGRVATRRATAGSKYFLRENISGSKYFLRGFKQKWNKFSNL